MDNNIDPSCWGASDLARFAAEMPGAVVCSRRAPHGDLPSDISRYDRVVLSGSLTSALKEAPWIDRLDELIRKSLNFRKPLLGVCYGHQALARVLSGRAAVRRSESPEFGWTRLETIHSSALTAGLPRAFYSFSSHEEEVATLPRGARRLLYSERCAVQAFELEGQPVFGVQFHPEKNLAEAVKSLAGKKRKGQSKFLLCPNDSEKLYDERIGKTIFRNFFTL